MHKLGRLIFLVFAAASSSLALSNDRQSGAQCTDALTSVHCASVVTPALDRFGNLWVTYAFGQYVYVGRYGQNWKALEFATRVNSEPQTLCAKGENRPKIAFGKNDEIYLSWTEKTEGKYTGDIRFSRSLDKGQSFDPPIIVNDDGLRTSHRFDALSVDDNGHVYLVWLDKRDKLKAKAKGEAYRGTAVFYAISKDQGETFVNEKLFDYSCECCRIAITSGRGGKPAVLWRHIFAANTRDHALYEFAQSGRPKLLRASHDGWNIDACPHHGPALDYAQPFYHMAWFTGGVKTKGCIMHAMIPRSSRLLINAVLIRVPLRGGRK